MYFDSCFRQFQFSISILFLSLMDYLIVLWIATEKISLKYEEFCRIMILLSVLAAWKTHTLRFYFGSWLMIIASFSQWMEISQIDTVPGTIMASLWWVYLHKLVAIHVMNTLWPQEVVRHLGNFNDLDNITNRRWSQEGVRNHAMNVRRRKHHRNSNNHDDQKRPYDTREDAEVVMARMINARCDGWERLNVYHNADYEAWFVGRSRMNQW